MGRLRPRPADGATDPDAFVIAGLPTQPRVYELEAYAAVCVLLAWFRGPWTPGHQTTLEFARLRRSIVALESDIGQGPRRRASGHRGDGTREVTATVTTVDEATGIVSLDRALHSDQVWHHLAGRSGPQRIANAYKFSRWHLTGVAVGAVLLGFNPALRPVHADRRGGIYR
jgi:hypothetical protein